MAWSMEQLDRCDLAHLAVCLEPNDTDVLSPDPLGNGSHPSTDFILCAIHLASVYHCLRALLALSRWHGHELPFILSNLKCFYISNIIFMTSSGLLLVHEKHISFFRLEDWQTHGSFCRVFLWLARAGAVASNWYLFLNVLVIILRTLADFPSILTAFLRSSKIRYGAILYISLYAFVHRPGDFYFEYIGACHTDDLYFCQLQRNTYRHENQATISLYVPLALNSLYCVVILLGFRGGDNQNRHARRRLHLYALSSNCLVLVCNSWAVVYLVCGEGCFSAPCVEYVLTSGWILVVIAFVFFSCLSLSRLSSSLLDKDMVEKKPNLQQAFPMSFLPMQ